MRYAVRHASPAVRASAHRGGAPGPGGRPALRGRLYLAPLPDHPRQCPWRAGSGIARSLGCSDQTVRNAIRAFDAQGVAALAEGSSRPHTVHAAFDDAGAERLRALLHRSPRDFGHPTSVWTLELAAEVAWTEGITATRVSDETVRATLERLGIRWRRAKRWITSPDPAYAQKTAA